MISEAELEVGGLILYACEIATDRLEAASFLNQMLQGHYQKTTGEKTSCMQVHCVGAASVVDRKSLEDSRWMTARVPEYQDEGGHWGSTNEGYHWQARREQDRETELELSAYMRHGEYLL